MIKLLSQILTLIEEIKELLKSLELKKKQEEFKDAIKKDDVKAIKDHFRSDD